MAIGEPRSLAVAGRQKYGNSGSVVVRNGGCREASEWSEGHLVPLIVTFGSFDNPGSWDKGTAFPKLDGYQEIEEPFP